MSVYYRTEAIAIDKDDFKEADEIFTLYTKEFGKIQVLAKAIRKIKSKLRSSIDIFCLSNIEFIQGKIYKTLTDALKINNFKNLKKDIDKIKTASKISELLKNLISAPEKDEKIWLLLKSSFLKLDETEKKYNYQLIYLFFLWNLLSFLGYKIGVYKCIFCSQKLKPKNLYFNAEEGGIICFNCVSKIKKAESISPETIKVIRFFLEKPLAAVLKLKIPIIIESELNSISNNYLDCVIEKQGKKPPGSKNNK